MVKLSILRMQGDWHSSVFLHMWWQYSPGLELCGNQTQDCCLLGTLHQTHGLPGTLHHKALSGRTVNATLVSGMTLPRAPGALPFPSNIYIISPSHALQWLQPSGSCCRALFKEHPMNDIHDGTGNSIAPPPLCISYALVQATVGVGTVLIWWWGGVSAGHWHRHWHTAPLFPPPPSVAAKGGAERR